MKKLNEYKTKILSFGDKEYPYLLKNIYDPPKKIYYKGDINLLKHNKIIAMVGCRDCTNYGKRIAFRLSYLLNKNDFIIVSGLASGIDSYSHKGSVFLKRPTIAVLGNGLDYIYPKENKALEEEILNNGGLIISEYPNKTTPTRYTFPARNRIISGLSKGVIVVEAKEKSGSLITVDYALNQGRTVYSIPGNIDSINSIGTNQIIKEGAKIVTKLEDILEDF